MDLAPSRPLLATADPRPGRRARAAGRRCRVPRSTVLDVARGGAAGVGERAGGAGRRRPRSPALVALAPPRRPGVQVVAWSPPPHGVVPRRAAGRAPSGWSSCRSAPSRSPSCSPTSARPAARTEPSSGWSAAPAAPARPPSRARSARSPRRAGPTLVVDLDPLGPGCDRVLALDDVPGVRWDSLASASGRLSRAVPARGGAPPRRAGRARLARVARPARRRRGPRGALGGAARPRHRRRRPAALGRPRRRDRARCALVVVLVVPTVTRGGLGGALGGRAARRTGRVGAGGPRARRRARRGSPRWSARRCSPRWPTSAGWPSRSTSGSGPVRSRRGPLARGRPRAARPARRSRPGVAAA